MIKSKKIIALILAFTLILGIIPIGQITPAFASDIDITATESAVVLEEVTQENIPFGPTLDLTSDAGLIVEDIVGEQVSMELVSNNYTPINEEEFKLTSSISTNLVEVDDMVVSFEIPTNIQVINAPVTNDVYEVSTVASMDASGLDVTVYNISFLDTVEPNSQLTFEFNLKFDNGTEEGFSFVPFAKVEGKSGDIAINVEKIGKSVVLTSSLAKEIGNVVIKATNSVGKPVEGAVFEIRSEGQVLETITSGPDGKAVSTIVYQPGSYQFAQTVAPEGHEIDPTVVDFYVEEGVTSAFQVICYELGAVKGTKGNMGAIFTVYDEVSFAPLEGAVLRLTTRSDPNTTIQLYTTDANGQSIIDGYGTGTTVRYDCRELTPAYGYGLSSNGTQEIVDFDMAANYLVPFYFEEDKIESGIEIFLKDEVASPIANAEFEVYAADGTTLLKTYITDADGKVMTYGHKSTGEMVAGTYVVKQKNTKAGYAIDTTPQTVVLEAGQTVPDVINFVNTRLVQNAKIKKVDSSAQPLAGAQFQVYDASNNNPVGPVVTSGADGYATTGTLVPGNYYFKEVQAPSGYLKDTITQKNFTIIANQTATSTAPDFVNAKDLETVNVTLTDGASPPSPLQGGIFALKDSGSNTINTITTDAFGNASITGLAPGTYTLEQTNTIVGYTPINTAVNVIIADDGISAPVNVAITNSPDGTGSIIINKVDGHGNPLAGATFTVDKVGGGFTTQTITSDAMGVAQTTGDLPIGSYTIIETVAPAGYTALSGSITANIAASPNNVATQSVTNANNIGILEVNKTDGNSNPLAGAEFAVKDAGGTVVKQFTTDATGTYVISDLASGTYKLVETKAPYGYVLDTTEYVFQITSGGTDTVTFDISNQLVEQGIEIFKVDENAQPLDGATFEISQNNVLVETLVPVGGKAMTTSNLAPGTYEIKETVAPTGYVLATNTISVVIDASMTTPEQRTIVNNPIANTTGGIKITVRDSVNTNQAVANASFKITSGTAINGVTTRIDFSTTARTDGTGEVTISGLEPGDYYIEQTGAPGYTFSTTPLNVMVNANAVTNVPVIYNTKIKTPPNPGTVNPPSPGGNIDGGSGGSGGGTSTIYVTPSPTIPVDDTVFEDIKPNVVPLGVTDIPDNDEFILEEFDELEEDTEEDIYIDDEVVPLGVGEKENPHTGVLSNGQTILISALVVAGLSLVYLRRSKSVSK